ncbi:MAG: homoserine kinase [Planctomycetota bacterium]
MTEPLQFTVPATCAHLGPGFGALGLAVDIPLHITVTEDCEPGHHVVHHGEMSGTPEDPRHDGILRALEAGAERFAIKLPDALTITAKNTIPAGTGLGTSSAGFAAGFGTVVRYAKEAPPADELTDLLVDLGGTAAHGGAALYGGLVASCPVQMAKEKVAHRVFRYPLSAAWRFVLACPKIHIGTADARRVLPARLPHGVIKRTTGRLLGLLHALAEGDEALLRKCITDEVHVPYRRRLLPGLDEAIQAGEEAGAAGVTISGAGPALLALTADESKAPAIRDAMATALAASGAEAELLTVEASANGALPLPQEEPAES